MKNNDVQLIHRILDGDDSAFTELVNKYRKAVHALVWRKIEDFHIAEEITQDTFLKAYQKLGELKKPQSFASWLYVIASRCCKEWSRKKRIPTLPLEETSSLPIEKTTYSQYVIEENERTVSIEQREIVQKLLAKLPESERTVITLHYFSEMSSVEIGAFLGVSANTIRSRLRRARQRLKKEETMIREALEHFQISPNLTDNIMREVCRKKPAPSGSKPLKPWVIAASSAVLLVLMLGIGNQYLKRFQKPYSLDAQAEMLVEVVDTSIVQNLNAKSDRRNQLGNPDAPSKNNGVGKKNDDTASLDIALAEENQANKGATIRGEVLEATPEQNPLERVKVTLVSGKDDKLQTTLTDKNGEYKFTGLPEGPYIISVSKEGYGDQVGVPKVVAAGGEIYETIKMRQLRGGLHGDFNQGMLQHIAESIGKRYKLDTPIIQELNKSIQNAHSTVFKEQVLEMKEYPEVDQFGRLGLVIAMLTHPVSKAALTKHISETQLQDYTNFIMDRRLKINQAVAQVITAYLDQELSLTLNQRNNLSKLLLEKMGEQNRLPILVVTDEPMQKGIVKLIHDELKISLDSILSETQSKIWSDIVTQKYSPNIIVPIDQHGLKVNLDQLLIKNNEDITKSNEWDLAEAKLMAHTQLLGELNESAIKRLKVVTKGVIQHFVGMEKPLILDRPKPNVEFNKLFLAYLDGSITREQAIKKLEVMRKDLFTKRKTVKQWEDTHYHNITDHPLYQQAIEDVLSEDAYLRYKNIQKERETYRIQAVRDLLVSVFDIMLLLNDPQWKHVKMATQHFTIPMLRFEGLQIMLMELFIMIDKDMLTPWQQRALTPNG